MVPTYRGADGSFSSLSSCTVAIASTSVSTAISVTGRSESSNLTFAITSSTIAITSGCSSSTKIGTSSGSVYSKHRIQHSMMLWDKSNRCFNCYIYCLHETICQKQLSTLSVISFETGVGLNLHDWIGLRAETSSISESTKAYNP